MGKIEEIDRNFKVAATVVKDGLAFYNVEQPPFSVHGVFREGDRFRRLPETVAKATSEGVTFLHSNTAGGRVRFRTNSQRVAIQAEMPVMQHMGCFTTAGSAGLDLYADNVYRHSYIPHHETKEGSWESVADLGSSQWREITLNLPLYSDVSSLCVGLDEDAALEAAAPYDVKVPVVYYGSSITQGGCAARPGMSYQSIVSRRLRCEYINLGFSGNAKAEESMIEYIKNLTMSVFVYDYDHNAPTAEYLQSTHEKMFKAIRAAQPDLPIVMMTAPIFAPNEAWAERSRIVEKTYQNAVEAGDKNVYFLNGAQLMALCGGEGTVDGCHPTDLGFFSMAQAVGDVLEPLLSAKE